MANKPLIIDVDSNYVPTNGNPNEWSTLGNTGPFIQRILTPSIAKGTNIGQLVSGIPTAFARVDLFNKAIRYVSNAGSLNAGPQNILSYYQQLVDEWKGFIACIALDYANIKVRKVELAYSDGKDVKSTANIYEMKGAFGNMLLKRAPLWCDQNLAENETAIPYLNIVKYREQVVGAACPDTLLFTSTGYKLDDDEKPWVDKKTSRFTDPLNSRMDCEQTVTLYAYIEHLAKGLNKFEEYYSNLPKDLQLKTISAIQNLLNSWNTKIKAYADENGYLLELGSIPPVSVGFGGAFNGLFSHRDVLYGLEGTISETKTNDADIEFDPKNLLLDETSSIAPININIKQEDIRNLPILVMTAERKGDESKKDYFALPLSAQGLNVFGRNTAALVGMMPANAIKSTLKATYDPSLRTGNLEVVLTLMTKTEKPRSFRKVYTAGQTVMNKDILIWPNFISPQWGAYYMYNELPHNGTTNEYKAYPFVGQMQNDYFRIMVDDSEKPLLLSERGKITAPKEKVDAKILVCSNEQVADNNYKYEIYQSNKPFKGVRLESPTKAEGGYLLINYSADKGNNKLPQDWMASGLTPILKDAALGIDFGSTNTSIAFYGEGSVQGFNFTNQRVSLFGKELYNENVAVKENHILFFQGFGCDGEIPSNSIKSVLTLHDSRRLPQLGKDQTRKMRDSESVIGGFPCFVENLPLVSANSKNIFLKFPSIGQVTQVHNMKWEDDDESISHKSAFLRTLMLQVYAVLFEKGFVPTSLRWSYPSSMKGTLLNKYSEIWEDLSKLSPVLKDDTTGAYDLKVSLGRPKVDFGGQFGSGGSFGAGNSGGFGSNSDRGFGASESGGFGFSSGFGTSESDGFGLNSGSGFGAGGSSCGFGFNSGSGFSLNSEGDFSKETSTNSESRKDASSDFMPDVNEQEIVYEPQLFSGTGAMSEAEAVANFNASQEMNAGELILCFDVGGSTTDISALYQLNGQVTMIKQNSIRFAAQRVSNVAGMDPRFRNVLKEVCQDNNIKMLGLNYGPDSYDEQTAPYFFNQIVNRLRNDQLPSLYSKLNSNCSKLMCVNLYVTGLLMYYGGQIARKLVADIRKSAEWPRLNGDKPKVRITFAGKGSCLYQWLLQVNPNVSYEFYKTAFILGYGKQEYYSTLYNDVRIDLPELGAQNASLKYEVSKGLALGNSKLHEPKIKHPSEIIGENGFVLVGDDNGCREVDFTNSITPKMIQYIGQRFVLNNNKSEKFTEYCGFFYNVVKQLYGWDVDVSILVRACNEMNITRYIQNLPEFRESQRDTQNGFTFVAPVIILEGMKFYDETLMKIL